MTENRVFAWHFLADNLKLSGGKWRNPIVRPKVTYVHKGPLEPRIKGLHASMMLLDALAYANGPIVTRVECSDRLEEHTVWENRYPLTKMYVCGRRKVLWLQNMSSVLHEFALWCAERVSTHPIIQAKRDWLQGVLPSVEFSSYREDLASKPETPAWDMLMSAARSQAWLAARDTSLAILEQTDEAEKDAERHMQNDLLVRGANELHAKYPHI